MSSGGHNGRHVLCISSFVINSFKSRASKASGSTNGKEKTAATVFFFPDDRGVHCLSSIVSPPQVLTIPLVLEKGQSTLFSIRGTANLVLWPDIKAAVILKYGSRVVARVSNHCISFRRSSTCGNFHRALPKYDCPEGLDWWRHDIRCIASVFGVLASLRGLH